MIDFIVALLFSMNLTLSDVTMTEHNGAYVIITADKIIIVKPNQAGGEPIVVIDTISGARGDNGKGNGGGKETP